MRVRYFAALAESEIIQASPFFMHLIVVALYESTSTIVEGLGACVEFSVETLNDTRVQKSPKKGRAVRILVFMYLWVL